MFDQWFKTETYSTRLVRLPDALTAAERATLHAEIQKCVSMARTLAVASDAFLSLTGAVEMDGDHLVIHHEPARPLDTAKLLDPDQRPDLPACRAFLETLRTALSVLKDRNVVHGNLQPAALYLDQRGRLKVGDCGIGAALTTLSGEIPAGLAVMETEGGLAWEESPAGEPEFCNAAFFTDRLLQREAPFSHASDACAAGVLAYVFATGSHPWKASWGESDPGFRLLLEPVAPQLAREDWQEAFDRHENQLATREQIAVVTWWEEVASWLGASVATPVASACERPIEPADAVGLLVHDVDGRRVDQLFGVGDEVGEVSRAVFPNRLGQSRLILELVRLVNETPGATLARVELGLPKAAGMTGTVVQFARQSDRLEIAVGDDRAHVEI